MHARSWFNSIVILTLMAAPGLAADWPTYRADISRSGVAGESLTGTLQQQWLFSPAMTPAEGWPEAENQNIWKANIPFMQAIRYDDSYHVAAVGNDVFFSASGESKIYCINAATATIKWVVTMGAPSRTAPTVVNGKVYVGSDDGYVYCLDAANGAELWKFHAAATDAVVTGQGHVISIRPVRTGVMVDGGVAYFGAGMYPNDGLRLYAVNANTGAQTWVNSTYGNSNNLTPQGYLLASADTIIMPSGRIMPATFNRSTGAYRWRLQLGRSGPNGGSYAVLDGPHLYNGTNSITAYDITASYRDKWNNLHWGPVVFSWGKAREIVASGSMLYMVNDTDVFAIPASQAAAAVGTETGFETNSSPDWTKTTWRRTGQNVPEALILSGTTLYAGGVNKVVAYNAANGSTIWTGTVDGTARGLAVANGRLFVSTTNGKIYCFSATSGSTVITPPASTTPFPADSLTNFYQSTAQQIVNQSQVNRGFAVVLGGAAQGRPGQLGYEIAKLTNLKVYVVETTAARAAQARAAMHSAGYHGKVLVLQGSVINLPVPNYIANLLVSEDVFFGGTMTTPATEYNRVLRPNGGVAYTGQPDGGAAFGSTLPASSLNSFLDGLGASMARQVTNSWVHVVRGKLPTSADWNHQYSGPGNTNAGLDQVAQGPFSLLWFGNPGPRDMVDRHARTAAPLVVNGRTFISGNNVVLAYDAYNGTMLWRREFTSSKREHMPYENSPIAAANEEYLFVTTGNQCHKLDAATGVTLQTYTAPSASGRRWGWLAIDGNTVFGSRTTTGNAFRSWPDPQYYDSDMVFAMNMATGATVWTYTGVGIQHNTLTVGGGKVYLLDKNMTQAQKDQATSERIEEFGAFVDRLGQQIAPDPRLLVALDVESGQKLWERPRDVADCRVNPAGGDAAVMFKNDIVVVAGSPFHQSHQLSPYNAGDFVRRTISAFSANTGAKIWAGQKNYQTRPLIVGNMIYAEPWGYDLATGAQRMSGSNPWQLFRGYGGTCGSALGGGDSLFYGQPLGYYHLPTNSGTMQMVRGQRTGCWTNFIPANGLMVMPEASSGCTCGLAIQGSVAFYPTNYIEPSGTFVEPTSIVTGVHIFYNGSSFDGNNIYANTQDDNAVATDKFPLLPGETATFANYTSYTAGINGIMVDIDGAEGVLLVDDFEFRVGNSNDPSTWAVAPAPRSVHNRAGAGVGGAQRTTIIWDNNLIQNKWLQITVKSTSRTALSSPKVFYYGNAIGESGDSPILARVDTTDEIGARQDPHKSAMNPATITNRHDYNRDGKVDTLDEIFARFNRTNFLTELKLITVPEPVE